MGKRLNMFIIVDSTRDQITAYKVRNKIVNVPSLISNRTVTLHPYADVSDHASSKPQATVSMNKLLETLYQS